MHGRGLFTWANGDSYKGEFLNDACTGDGAFFSSDYNTIISGKFENFKLINGMIHENDDEHDDRDLITIVENGEEVSQYILFDDGNTYFGQREGLVPQGYGMLISESGEKTIGTFENGEFIG